MTEPKDEKNGCNTGAEKIPNLLRESNELAVYISRHGDILPMHKIDSHKELLVAISDLESSPTQENWTKLHLAYSAVTTITYATKSVNGRTIIETRRKAEFWRTITFQDPRHRPVQIGVILFVLAMFFELLAARAARIFDPTVISGYWVCLAYTLSPLLTFLIPAVWGGIGACIFLMKKLADKLFDQAFDSRKVKGDVTRIFLGSMMGVIVVVIMFPGFSEAIKVGDFSFGPASAAFIAGLGVKPIYAAFESLSEELARRFSGGKTKD